MKFRDPILEEMMMKRKRDKAILAQAKKEKSIVYGAQSIKARRGVLARNTEDWDIFSKSPKKSAKTTEKKLDKIYKRDQFYTKPAMHPGTHKVMSKGADRRKGTKDDWGVADYTKMPKPKPPVNKINGVRFRTLAQEAKAKRTSLRDKTQKFRHKKDSTDLAIIEWFKGL